MFLLLIVTLLSQVFINIHTSSQLFVMGEVMCLAPSKLLRVFKNNAVCFHKNLKTLHERTTQRCFHEGKDIMDDKKKIFKVRHTI